MAGDTVGNSLNMGNGLPYNVSPMTNTRNPPTEYFAEVSPVRCLNAVQGVINTSFGDDVAVTNFSVQFWRRTS